MNCKHEDENRICRHPKFNQNGPDYIDYCAEGPGCPHEEYAIEMIVPEPKIIKSWSDFDGEKTEKYYLDNWENYVEVIRISSDELMLDIWKETTIPEAILILNSLGFNFAEG